MGDYAKKPKNYKRGHCLEFERTCRVRSSGVCARPLPSLPCLIDIFVLSGLEAACEICAPHIQEARDTDGWKRHPAAHGTYYTSDRITDDQRNLIHNRIEQTRPGAAPGQSHCSERHSSGPWIVDEVNTPNGVGYFINHLWTDEAGEAHIDEIAEVQMDYRGDVARRNADLLAAAPTMEESLARILVMVHQGLDDADIERIEAECRESLAAAWGIEPDKVGTPDLDQFKEAKPADR